MTDTRRSFIQTAAGIAAALSGAEASPQTQTPDAQVPKMRFGGEEISRLVAGCNCFYGYAHFNQILATVMREYYTTEKVCEVLHQCNRYGINAHNYLANARAIQDLDRFQAAGGKMHLIVQGQGEQTDFIRKYKPLAIYHHGEMTDRAVQNGELDVVKDWVKKTRDLGVKMVGVGTHKPEVIAEIESQGWNVDFYAGCVYNRTRTRDEWLKALGGEPGGNAGRMLPPERPAAHVPGDASDQQAVFRVQDHGRGPGVECRRGVQDGVREYQTPSMAFSSGFSRGPRTRLGKMPRGYGGF